jgi:MraZ protein
MFRGVSILSLDSKGRLAIPTRYRPHIQEESAGRLVLTISNTERCLWLYPLNRWEEVEENISRLPGVDQQSQRLRRMLLGHATDCELDGSGRVLLPGPLREYGEIEKRVAMLGQGNKFEIWSEPLWNAQRESWLAPDRQKEPMPLELESLVL